MTDWSWALAFLAAAIGTVVADYFVTGRKARRRQDERIDALTERVVELEAFPPRR